MVRLRPLVLALLAALSATGAAEAQPRDRSPQRMPAVRVSVDEAAERPATSPTLVGPTISITRVQDMGFGKLAAGATTGTVTIAPNGSRSATGGATLANGGSARAASFTVTTTALLIYNITLPGSSTLSDGTHTMTVNTFTSNPSGTGQVGLGGTQTLLVGAKLQVGANQAAGSYSGTFSVTVVLP